MRSLQTLRTQLSTIVSRTVPQLSRLFAATTAAGGEGRLPEGWTPVALRKVLRPAAAAMHFLASYYAVPGASGVDGGATKPAPPSEAAAGAAPTWTKWAMPEHGVSMTKKAQVAAAVLDEVVVAALRSSLHATAMGVLETLASDGVLAHAPGVKYRPGQARPPSLAGTFELEWCLACVRLLSAVLARHPPLCAVVSSLEGDVMEPLLRLRRGLTQLLAPAVVRAVRPAHGAAGLRDLDLT